MKFRRIGIVGYGNLGKYLVNAVLEHGELELAFVWNRSIDSLIGNVDDRYILDKLENFKERAADLIVEVAHPDVTAEYGVDFVKNADLMVGSPTVFAESDVSQMLRKASDKHGIYIPSGAFWGGEDIKKMADRRTLQMLKVTMKKHPDSFKFNEPLKSANEKVTEATVLYDGCVRDLCPLAPNNVNTMAAAALAGHNLGFDSVQGCLVADPMLTDSHIVEIDAWGPGDIESGTAFHVHTVRTNPAKVGNVTGTATYQSFLSSMLGAHGKGSGIHLC